MEWTEDHDLLLMREMMISDLFLYKNGSPNRGLVWDSIVENNGNEKMMESQALLLQQQQQMSMAFLATMQKFTEK